MMETTIGGILNTPDGPKRVGRNAPSPFENEDWQKPCVMPLPEDVRIRGEIERLKEQLALTQGRLEATMETVAELAKIVEVLSQRRSR